MDNAKDHDPAASATITIHLDYKSKQDFANSNAINNKYNNELKEFSNKFTLKPETTQAGGAN